MKCMDDDCKNRAEPGSTLCKQCGEPVEHESNEEYFNSIYYKHLGDTDD